jgi:hypothetical protein
MDERIAISIIEAIENRNRGTRKSKSRDEKLKIDKLREIPPGIFTTAPYAVVASSLSPNSLTSLNKIGGAKFLSMYACYAKQNTYEQMKKNKRGEREREMTCL